MDYSNNELRQALALYKQKIDALEAQVESQRRIIENNKAMERFNAEMYQKLEKNYLQTKEELAQLSSRLRALKTEAAYCMPSHVTINNNYGTQGTVMNSIDEMAAGDITSGPL